MINYKHLIIVMILFQIFSLASKNWNGYKKEINYNMLDKRNKKIWKYYHKLNKCEKINFYDSCMKVLFSSGLYTNSSHKKKYYNKSNPNDSIIPLFNTKHNNFYGYIYWDIYDGKEGEIDTLCCSENKFSDGKYFVPIENLIETEYSPPFKDSIEFTKLIELWKQKANCK